MKKAIEKDLVSKGFGVIGTGGNCTAWALGIDDIMVLVSDDSSAELDGPDCFVSVFDEDGYELHHESVPVEQAASRALYLANEGVDNLIGTCGQCGEQGQIRTVCRHCGRGVFE